MIKRILAAATLGLGLALTATPALAGAGDSAQGFSLRDIDNRPVALDDFDGQVVVISFWATWCGPCKEEMPHLEKMYKELKAQGFVVLSISADDARSASMVKPFIKRQRYTFPVLLDKQSKVTGMYNPAKTLPYTVLIGRDGKVAWQHAGYTPGDEEHLKELVLEELAKSASGEAPADGAEVAAE